MSSTAISITWRNGTAKAASALALALAGAGPAALAVGGGADACGRGPVAATAAITASATVTAAASRKRAVSFCQAGVRSGRARRSGGAVASSAPGPCSRISSTATGSTGCGGSKT